MTPSQQLLEWWRGRDFLLISRKTADGLDLDDSGFIEEITRDEILMNLLETGELRLPLLSDTTLRFSELANEEIKCSVIVEGPECTYLLSLRRKQPVINYPDE